MSADESGGEEISVAHLYNNSETYKKGYRYFVLPLAGWLKEGQTILHKKNNILRKGIDSI